MPVTLTAVPTIVNTSQLGGNQTQVRTAALANGGFVVAWQSDFGSTSTVFFQRFDETGAKVGSTTQVAKPTGNTAMSLRDIAVADDGTFTILSMGGTTVFAADQRVFVDSYSDTTGLSNGPQIALNLTALGPNGIANTQLVHSSTSPAGTLSVATTVNDASFNTDLVLTTVTTAGTVTVAPAVVNNNYGGGAVTELVDGFNGSLFALNSSSLIDTVGTVSGITGGSDVITTDAGTLIFARTVAGSAQVTLLMFTGNTSSITNYQASTAVIATSASGLTSVTDPDVFATELVDLGSGRILIVWVADGGETFPGGIALVDGVYAQVYNMNTGSNEGNAVQILNMGVGPNDPSLQAIAISADLMEDGRVALSLSYVNGLSGADVFSTILDPRVAGVALTATTGVDNFVGSAFDDTFSGVLNGDVVSGGNGTDTVVLTDAAAHNIDLAAPGNFPATTLVLSSIENLTGNDGADDLRGNNVGNILLGAGGSDSLYGRLGDDTLGGGALDDLLRGDAGADLLNGDDGNDSLLGGADNDLLFGGIGDDRGRGGSGDDTVNGDAGNDRLFGGDGADTITGGDGDDGISGDAGDDQLFGGAGNDTLRGDDGSDELYGGGGNDILRALSGAQVVDGGVGVDRLVIGDRLFAPGTAGVHVDLTGDFDVFDLVDEYVRFSATITQIENVTGTAGDDFIAGDSGSNVLRGGKGDDMLFGRAGSDTLIGGAGADGFIFSGAATGSDRIADFEMASDKIWLVDGSFGDIGQGNLATRLTINATGTVGANANAQLIFDNAGAGFGTLSFDADGNGAGAAVVLAVLVPTTGELVALTASNFGFL